MEHVEASTRAAQENRAHGFTWAKLDRVTWTRSCSLDECEAMPVCLQRPDGNFASHGILLGRCHTAACKGSVAENGSLDPVTTG